MERLLVLMLTVGVCSGWGQTQAAANQLTVEEQREGFTLLFDGKSLDGWDVRPGQEAVWRVLDGVIENDSSAPGATLLTKQDFANYVLKAEFRAHPGVNSGLMLRQRREGSGPPAATRGRDTLAARISGEELDGSQLQRSVRGVSRGGARLPLATLDAERLQVGAAVGGADLPVSGSRRPIGAW